MNEQELVLQVKARAGLRTAREASRAVGAAVGALRCALADDDAQALALQLPARFKRLLDRAPGAAVQNARALYVEAERRERVGLGFAMEHTQAVLEVLAELLDPELVGRLRKRLPSSIAGLLRGRSRSYAPPAYAHEHPEQGPAPRQTLSRARPGTAEPIAEARHELAHAQSVARSTAPHADRAVATARSTRPGREDETLATTRDGRTGK
ncbi:MAG TPA: DUF2267 domain-containing protein [Polyangiaceae bacterium]|nr:DUF2267 domain-containing protein [Polyangiaceae bacterium]